MEEVTESAESGKGKKMNLSIFKLLFTKPASGSCGKETSFKEFIFTSC